MSYLPDRDSNGHIILHQNPFAAKEIDGKKLFKRVHGATKACVAGVNEIEFTVPYAQVKLNKIEIMWAPEGCTVDFEVYDSVDGLIQQSMGVPAESVNPNFHLNQFGFGAVVAKDYYEQHSEYDADLIGGMRVKCEITCPTGTDKTIGVNFILNELK